MIKSVVELRKLKTKITTQTIIKGRTPQTSLKNQQNQPLLRCCLLLLKAIETSKENWRMYPTSGLALNPIIHQHMQSLGGEVGQCHYIVLSQVDKISIVWKKKYLHLFEKKHYLSSSNVWQIGKEEPHPKYKGMVTQYETSTALIILGDRDIEFSIPRRRKRKYIFIAWSGSFAIR